MGITNKSSFRMYMEIIMVIYMTIFTISFLGLKLLGYSVGVSQILKVSLVIMIISFILTMIVEGFNDYIEERYKKTEEYSKKELKAIKEDKEKMDTINKKAKEFNKIKDKKEKYLEEYGLSKAEIKTLSVGIMEEEDIEYLKEELGIKGG